MKQNQNNELLSPDPFVSIKKMPGTSLFTQYTNVKVVDSFDELLSTPFVDNTNALCWRRELFADFDQIVQAIGHMDEICTVGDDYLKDLPLDRAGQAARDILINDQRLLQEAGLDPILDYIPAYPRDPEAGPVPTDVYSFHADSATIETDTYLCSYNVASSEGIRNEDAIRKVDIPEIRSKLLEQFGGIDDEGFLQHLNENCFDLHYAARAHAVPFSFGLGNMWRIATQWPGSPVPPCIHRAPTTITGQAPRLLLIS